MHTSWVLLCGKNWYVEDLMDVGILNRTTTRVHATDFCQFHHSTGGRYHTVEIMYSRTWIGLR